MISIEPEAVEWLEEYIKPDMTVFEYGSGSSTIYFVNRVKKVITVESYPDRYERYKRYNPHINLIKPTKENKLYPYSHQSYGSTDKEFDHLSFEDYVNYIKKYRNQYFDIVFINGRSRASCIMTAVPKVKIGGCVILNDSERYVYQNAIEIFLKEYPHQEYGEGTRKTKIWDIIL